MNQCWKARHLTPFIQASSHAMQRSSRRSLGWLVAALWILHSEAHAQSFNCAKTQTVVEHTICDSTMLGELDESLAAELKSALANASSHRKSLLAEERAWLADRDKQCVGANYPPGENLESCLAAAYRARIDALKKRVPDDVVSRLDRQCVKIADRYRVLADADSRKSPLQKLSESPASQITIFRGQVVDLDKWAQGQVPPIVVSEEVRTAWDQLALIEQGGVELTGIPGSNLYAAEVEAGTAHAVSTVYIAVRQGVAYRVEAPQEFEEEAAGVSRPLGRIDGTPVAFEEDYVYGPGMTSTLKVATWDAGQFSANCKLTFAFAPVFTREALNTWGESCEGSDCEALRQAAFEIVEAVQKSPRKARSQLLATLTSQQRAAFEGTDAAGSEEDQDPASLTMDNPFWVPYPHQGRVYIVSVGHQTVGWRYFADWGVKFDSYDDRRTLTFSVGMSMGPLKGISIAPHTWREVGE